jgi:O-antigen/teichoic acid export membrane protein
MARVVRGTVSGITGQALTLLFSLFATPVVVRKLGVEQYGIFALVNLITGYFAFCDVGMGAASTRFAAQAHAESDPSSEAAVIWTSLAIASVPTTLLAIALISGAHFIVIKAFLIPSRLQSTAAVVIQLGAITLVARTLASVLNTPQLVRLRLTTYTLISSGAAVTQIALAPVALLLHGGLVSAVAVATVVNCLAVSIHAIVSSHLLPALFPPRFRRELIGGLSRFGGALLISSIVGMTLVNGEKFLLTHYSSPRALAYYSVAYSLASLLMMAPSTLSQALLPAFTNFHYTGETDRLRALYLQALRIVLLGTVPLGLVILVTARRFLTIWVGAEYAHNSAAPLYVLVVGLQFGALAYVPYALLMAYGRAGTIASFELAELLPYLILAVGLTSRFGATGAAVAWAIRVVVNLYLGLRAAKSVSGFSPSLMSKTGLNYFLVITGLIVANGAIASSSFYAVRAPMLACTLFLYAFAVWKKLLESREQEWLKKILARYFARESA